MNRKTFLRQIGGAGMVAMLPVSSMLTHRTSDPIGDKKLKPKVVLAEDGKVLKILGNKQIHKLVGKDTNNQFFEWTDYLKPGSAIPPHVHTKENELFRVTKGTIEFMIGGKITILSEDDTILAPKNIPHAWKVIGDKEAQMNVTVFPAGMEFMFDELNALPLGRPDFERVAKISASYGITFIKN